MTKKNVVKIVAGIIVFSPVVYFVYILLALFINFVNEFIGGWQGGLLIVFGIMMVGGAVLEGLGLTKDKK